MNKQSVILTKWVSDSNTLLEDYSQLSLLLPPFICFLDAEDAHLISEDTKQIKNQFKKIDSMIAKSPVGTKFKITLEKVEE